MKTGTDYVLRIGYDDQPDCPMEWDCEWRFVSFDKRHVHYGNPDEFARVRDGVVVPASIGLRKKFDVGLAYWVDVYEHGASAYSLHGGGMQCPWDTSNYAGVLLWEHKPSELSKDRDARRKSAAQFLETYTAWANGWVYYFTLDPADHERDTGNGDSCGGFYEADYMSSVIAESLKPGDRIMLKGDCASVFDESKLPEGVEVVDEFDMEEIEAERLAQQLADLT